MRHNFRWKVLHFVASMFQNSSDNNKQIMVKHKWTRINSGDGRSYKNCSNFSLDGVFHKWFRCRVHKPTKLNWRARAVKTKINILLVSTAVFRCLQIANCENYRQTEMFIKLTLIGLAFVPLIIGKSSESPIRNSTRVGKLFGWLTGKSWPLEGSDPVGDSQLLTRLLLSRCACCCLSIPLIANRNGKFRVRDFFVCSLKVFTATEEFPPANWVVANVRRMDM